MEAIPRLMTSHQVNLCEAIITLCLDELRRIFRQQKKQAVFVCATYVLETIQDLFESWP